MADAGVATDYSAAQVLSAPPPPPPPPPPIPLPPRAGPDLHGTPTENANDQENDSHEMRSAVSAAVVALDAKSLSPAGEGTACEVFHVS